MNTFTNKIVEERQIKKPKLVLGADGSTSKCIVAGMILEADEEVELESVSKYKYTGQNRVFLLAKADGVPENRANYDTLLGSLDLDNLNEDFQVVCDFKLINIILGIQTCTSRFGCAFCIGCKVDSDGNFDIKNGTYKKGEMRTWQQISEQNDKCLE